MCSENISHDILNAIVDRNEEMFSPASPREDLIVFSLELHENLFSRAKRAVVNELVEALPNSGKHVRRIVPAPTVQDCTRVEAIPHIMPPETLIDCSMV